MRRTMTEQQLEQMPHCGGENYPYSFIGRELGTIPQYRKIHLPAQRVCRQWDAED